MNLRNRPPSGRAIPVLMFAMSVALIALVVTVVATLGLAGTLRLAGALALLSCAVVAVAVAALTVVLRRRLNELRHLPDLGRRFETHRDGVRLTAITTTTDGLVALIATESARTIVLDESGAPDEVRPEGPGNLRLPVSETEARRLQQATESGAAITLTSAGVIAITGPVRTSWRLEAAPGPAVPGR